MIENELAGCCNACEEIEIHVEKDRVRTTKGAKTMVRIYCDHCRVCKKYIEEKEEKTNQKTR